MVERTKAGLLAARARGRTGGRPKKLDQKKRELAVGLYNDRLTPIKEICSLVGITKHTLYKYIKEFPKDEEGDSVNPPLQS